MLQLPRQCDIRERLYSDGADPRLWVNEPATPVKP